MLKENSTIIRRTVICADLILLTGAFIGAFVLRFQRLPGTGDWRDYGWVTLIFIPTLLFNFYRAGLWQVSGRNKITDFDEIVKLDTNYIDQWSLWLDCKILGKTFMVIWSGN